MGALAQLAPHPQDTSREEVYLAVASLYRAQGQALSERERALMQDILRRLTNDIEISVRTALAERLAGDAKAPRDLILLLAADSIDVARPLLLRSPVLNDVELTRLVADCSIEHQQTIASRTNIGKTVTESLSRSEHECVLLALVQNTSARFSPHAYVALVEKSRGLPSLHEPLARRADLPPQLATRMHDQVSDSLKTNIQQNSIVASTNVTAVIDRSLTPTNSDRPPPKIPPTEGAQKLVNKLAASGQLKVGFLLRVLNQGQTDLFDLALAKLVDLPVIELRSRFYGGGPRAVALACRSVGIDRCVFSTVFNLSRQAHNMGTKLSFDELAEVDRVFATVPKSSALSELFSLTFN
jgi:uncharacterized protein (DUF2336 family)